MKFYLCQTPDGPQLAATQEEAKALDRKFEKIEIDMSQRPIMERLNELMRRVHAAEAGEPAEIDDDEEQIAAPAPKPVKASSDPNSATALMNRTWEQIGIEEWILAVPAREAYRLDNLASHIDTRRAEIELGLGG